MKVLLLMLTMLLLSIPTEAQSRPDQEQWTQLQQIPKLIQVQWLLVEGSSQRGSVFDLATPGPYNIGNWYDLPLYQGIPPPWRGNAASRFHFFDIQTVVNIPGEGDAFCELYAEVDESHVMRTGNNVLTGRWVPISVIDSNRWEVLDGGGWLVQDDNRQWRLSVTLIRLQ